MRLKNFDIKLRQYTGLVRKLISDSLLRFRRESFFVLVSGFFGVIFQVQAIALAIYYSRVMASGNTVNLLGHGFEPRKSIVFLAVTGTGVLLSLLLSAWLIYFSRSGLLKLGRTYEEFCSKRLLSLFGRSFMIWKHPEQSFSSDSTILRLARTDARYCGRIFRVLLSSVVPVITFVIAVLSLFYINPFLTSLIMGLMAVSAAFQYRVSVSGARNSSEMEDASRGAMIEYRRIIQSQKGTSASSYAGAWWIDDMLGNSEIKRFLDAYENRLKVVEKSRFVSDILLAIAISAILVTMGSHIIIQKAGWGSLIIYLVALRYMLVNLKQSVTRITGINRFLPQLKRYFQFLENTVPVIIDGVRVPEGYRLSAVTANNGSVEHWELGRGRRIGVISPVELNRYTVVYIMESLLAGTSDDAKNALNSLWFASARFEFPPGTVRESLGLPDGLSLDDFTHMMVDKGLQERLHDCLPDGLETRLAPEVWDSIGPDLRFALVVMSAVYSGCQWILLDEAGLRTLPGETREFLLGRLSDRIVVIVFSSTLEYAGAYGDEMFAVISDNGIWGIGPSEWLRAHESEIRTVLSQSATASSIHGSMADDIDDDQDDDDM